MYFSKKITWAFVSYFCGMHVLNLKKPVCFKFSVGEHFAPFGLIYVLKQDLTRSCVHVFFEFSAILHFRFYVHVSLWFSAILCFGFSVDACFGFSVDVCFDFLWIYVLHFLWIYI